MDFSAIGNSLGTALGAEAPRILGAIVILIIGWIVAVFVRAGIRRLLAAVRLNKRIADTTEQKFDLETVVSAAAFWLIILIALIGMFNSLNLTLASGPFEVLVKQIAAYLPRLVAGVLLVLVAWLAAVALRAIVNRVLDASGLDEKLSANAGMQPMRKSVGNMLFWLVILLFVPAILNVFDLGGLLDPVKVMVTKILDILPNLFAAFLIGFAGWLLGKVLAGLVTNILAAAGADQGAHRLGLDSTLRISHIIGTIVLIFVFVPALIAALDALKIEAISRPATDMLGKMFAAVPNIVAAALILVVTYYVAKFAADLLGRLLNSMGFDTLPEKAWTRGSLRRGWAAVAAGIDAGPVLRDAVCDRGSGEPSRIHPGSRCRDAVHQTGWRHRPWHHHPPYRLLAGQPRAQRDSPRRHHELGESRHHRSGGHTGSCHRDGAARDGYCRRHCEPGVPLGLRGGRGGDCLVLRTRRSRGCRQADGALAGEIQKRQVNRPIGHGFPRVRRGAREGAQVGRQQIQLSHRKSTP